MRSLSVSRLKTAGLGFVAALALGGGATPDPRLNESGFLPLFDGQTLAGWTIKCLPKDQELAPKGTTIQSVLNGVTVVNYDGAGVLDDELHRKLKVGLRGMIGLQIHSNDELKLRFKDLRIRSL
jgi:hypothetical protein